MRRKYHPPRRSLATAEPSHRRPRHASPVTVGSAPQRCHREPWRCRVADSIPTSDPLLTESRHPGPSPASSPLRAQPPPPYPSPVPSSPPSSVPPLDPSLRSPHRWNSRRTIPARARSPRRHLCELLLLDSPLVGREEERCVVGGEGGRRREEWIWRGEKRGEGVHVLGGWFLWQPVFQGSSL